MRERASLAVATGLRDTPAKLFKATREASGVKTWRSGATLPSPVLSAGVRRLGNFALLAGLLMLGTGVFDHLFFLRPPYRRDPIHLLAEGGAAMISFAMYVASRRVDVRIPRFLDVGLAYEVICAFLIAFVYYEDPASLNALQRGSSPVAVWIVVFPLIVPSTRGKAVLATIAAALMDPLGLAANVTLAHPAPSPFFLTQLFRPTALGVIAGIAGARILYRLSAEASRARDMGSYRLVTLLGHGGMGEVWRAEHRMLNRPAAIKLIRPGMAGDVPATETLARFEREAHATASLRSPHTVQVYDFGATDDGAFYYVMELLDGVTLETLVQRFGPQPEERVAHILRQVCQSLAEAHRSGLVHRDVKPSNIFLCRYGVDLDFVKVLDFGIVKSVAGGAGTELTGEGFVTGTPGYMAPEVALGRRDIDGRADLYALGCVAYFLLTGETVFPANGRTAMEVMIDHAQTWPMRPSRRAGRAMHPGLEDVVMACLAKEPNDRFESARELDGKIATLRLHELWTEERARGWWDRAGLPSAADGSASPPPGGTARSTRRQRSAS